MDLTMRLERALTRDFPALVAAVAAAENALTEMERSQEERFAAKVGTGFTNKTSQPDEYETSLRLYNIKAVRRDWDAFKAAMDAHVARELAEFVPLARRIAAGTAGISDEMIRLIDALDVEHQDLRKLALPLRTHALSVEPIRAELNVASSALTAHIRMHDVELTPQLNQGTSPGADRRDTEDRYRHSRSIRASSRPAPVREEKPKEGLLHRWFSLIRRQR